MHDTCIFQENPRPGRLFHPIWPVRGVREQVRVRELFVLFCGCVRVGCSRTRVFANCSFVFVRDLKSHEQPPLLAYSRDCELSATVEKRVRRAAQW